MENNFNDNEIVVLRTIEEIFSLRKDYEENNRSLKWFVIGGSTLYNYFLKNNDLLSDIHWTRIMGNYDCDTKINCSISNFLTLGNWIQVNTDMTKEMNRRMLDGSDKGEYYEMKRLS